jgi:hypothetical protein
VGDRAGNSQAEALADIYSPWDDAGARLEDWIIEHVSLGGLIEVMCWKRKVILLESDRTVAQRRSDLAHAIAHVDLGHRLALDRKNEQAADRLAAKRLISRQELVEAIKWTGGRIGQETAELLRVDIATLRSRLTYLHPAESSYIRRELMGCTYG